ncbi:hypothetical protein [Komagataeibacter medellinensis]|nr:hypothetical protein [Komagataeibacter medellinensis]
MAAIPTGVARGPDGPDREGTSLPGLTSGHTGATGGPAGGMKAAGPSCVHPPGGSGVAAGGAVTGRALRLATLPVAPPANRLPRVTGGTVRAVVRAAASGYGRVGCGMARTAMAAVTTGTMGVDGAMAGAGVMDGGRTGGGRTGGRRGGARMAGRTTAGPPGMDRPPVAARSCPPAPMRPDGRERGLPPLCATGRRGVPCQGASGPALPLLAAVLRPRGGTTGGGMDGMPPG